MNERIFALVKFVCFVNNHNDDKALLHSCSLSFLNNITFQLPVYGLCYLLVMLCLFCNTTLKRVHEMSTLST